MKLKLILYSDKRLKQKSVPVDKISGRLKELAESMLKHMKSWGGIGLSAPQVGENIRLLVFDTRSATLKGTTRIMFNPEILSSEDILKRPEGCLSFPGKILTISRPNKVTVRYLDKTGKEIEETFSGIAARAILHEIDHLDGILMTERVK